MPTILSASELRTFLRSQCHPDNLVVEGIRYCLPSRDWIFGPFALALSKNQFVLEVSKYRLQTNCCRHFAKISMVLASIMSDHTPANPDASLAFGTFSYVQDSGSGHEINFFLTSENGSLLMRFFEPQTCMETHLTETERSSAITVEVI